MSGGTGAFSSAPSNLSIGTGVGAFGSGTSTTNTSGGFGVFGSSGNNFGSTNTPNVTPSGFNNSVSSLGFGGAKNNAKSGFGLDQSGVANFGGYAGNTGNFMASAMPAFSNQTANMFNRGKASVRSSVADDTLQDLDRIAKEYGFQFWNQGYNGPDTQCRLKSIAFQIAKREVQAVRKPMFIETTQWQEAEQRANQLTEKLRLSASEERFVPVAFHGFEDLRNRIGYQDKHVEEIISQVGRLNTKLQDLKTKRDHIKEQIKDRLNNQICLCQRLMRLMEQVAVLQGRDLPLTPDEIRFRDVVESHNVRLNSPTEFKAKLSEITQLERMKQREPRQVITSRHVDYRNIFKALDKQRKGLDILTRHLKSDDEDMSVMLRNPPGAGFPY